LAVNGSLPKSKFGQCIGMWWWDDRVIII
jgi:hypothetical protein